MGKTIYIADDEKNIRELMRRFLENADYTVEMFATGDALYAAFKTAPCDMVILDVTMPGTDGMTLCEEIRAHSNVPIIIVSARDSELDRITGITVGSDDYLVKPFSPTELVVRVKALFRRMEMSGAGGEKVPLVYGSLTIDEKKRVAYCQGATLELSPTEFNFLTYMIKHREKAVSREELLKNIWQYDYHVDTRATDDTVKRLRKKLKGTGTGIGAVWGYGFKLECEEDENDHTV